MSQLQNKVVWITGASSGIGEALAYACAKNNCRLVLSSRREAELQRVKAACQLPDEQVLVLPLDLADHDDMPQKAAQVVDHFGRIDILLNNGGISQRSKVIDTEMAVYERLVKIDYLGTVAITKAALPYMVKQGSGHIGVVTSLMGKFAAPMRSGYCGAKHALHGFFDALRMEHHDDQIKVTLICPGFVRTNVSKNALTADGRPQNSMDEATDQGMSAEECARRILRAIERNKMEVVMGGKETIPVYLKRFFPSLVHRIVRKAKVT